MQSRLIEDQRPLDYLENERLTEFIDFTEFADYRERVFDSVSGKLEIPFPPQVDDLVRLHRLIRSRRPFTVLEFGVGYSTIIMADALAKNEAEWKSLPGGPPPVRNRFMFQLFAVDANNRWIARTRRMLPAHLSDRVHITYSTVEAGTYQGQLCHFYERIPDVIPDFIYLDGPFPKDVKGNVRGLSFHCDERTVLAGDPLLMESTFLPGTFMIIDGRTNNARFLERNFRRTWKVAWDPQGDVTTFELEEPRLGRYNVLGSDFFGRNGGDAGDASAGRSAPAARVGGV
jgi:hypothetical protein